MNLWKNILGFLPEKELEPDWFEKKCYKCESKNVERLDSGAWTGKFKCEDCGYFTYVVYTDRMGGGLTDSVAISKENSTSI